MSGSSKAHSPPTVPNAPNNIMGSFSSTLPVVIRYLPVTSMKMMRNGYHNNEILADDGRHEAAHPGHHAAGPHRRVPDRGGVELRRVHVLTQCQLPAQRLDYVLKYFYDMHDKQN